MFLSNSAHQELLSMDYPTCSIDGQKCPSMYSRCDRCSVRAERLQAAQKAELENRKGEEK